MNQRGYPFQSITEREKAQRMKEKRCEFDLNTDNEPTTESTIANIQYTSPD